MKVKSMTNSISSSKDSSKKSVLAKLKQSFKNMMFSSGSTERKAAKLIVSSAAVITADVMTYKAVVKATGRKHKAVTLFALNGYDSCRDVVKGNDRKNALLFLGYTVLRGIVMSRANTGITVQLNRAIGL